LLMHPPGGGKGEALGMLGSGCGDEEGVGVNKGGGDFIADEDGAFDAEGDEEGSIHVGLEEAATKGEDEEGSIDVGLEKETFGVAEKEEEEG